MVDVPVIKVVKKGAKRRGGVAPVGRMPEDRVDWHLWNWVRWHRTTGRPNLGYVTTRGVSGSSDFDSMARACDRKSAIATETAINDLPPAQSDVVYARHLYAVFRFPRENAAELYAEARATLALTLVKKHLF